MITINLLSDQENKLPICFHTACADFHQSNMRYAAGQQQFHQILLVLSGTGIVRSCGRELPLKRGCAFYTAVGTESEYINTGNLKTAFVTATGPLLTSLVSYYTNEQFLYTDKLHTESTVNSIQNIISEYYAHKRQGHLSSMVYSFFTDYFEQLHSPALTCPERIGLYIERTFTQKLTLESLAQQHGISVSKLCHDFKAAYGCSVFVYILHFRLTYARRLLQTSPDISIKQAALACGFEDVSYFCKAYKQKFDTTPSTDQKALL